MMPLTYTAEQVINKAASDLGKYVPGEALGAVEHDVISDRLDSVLAELSKIISIADRDEIPAVAFECIAEMTAIFASSEFSNVPVDFSPGGPIERIEQRLRYLIASTPTYEILPAYFF
jgi:hypothetical protein